MNKLASLFAAATLSASALVVSAPAYADGNVRCNGGPADKWQPMDKLKKKAFLEGWSLLKTQVDGDCYEVYARTDTGQAVEAFFHPVTLQKLLVLRRGKEIFRAKGFTG